MAPAREADLELNPSSVESLESRIEEVTRRLKEAERRLNLLEGWIAPGVLPGREAGGRLEALPVQVSQVGASAPSAPSALSESWVVLSGGTLVALGGAYLLRALTEAGTVPQAIGIALGLAYALLWTVLADRAAARGRRRSAVFYGLSTAIIVFPLLWETTFHMGFFSAPASAVAVAAAAFLALVVAWRRNLSGLAWVTFAGAVPATIALAFAMGLSVHYSFCLIALGLGALWLSYLRGWEVLGWLVAFAVDLMVLLETDLFLDTAGRPMARDLGPGSLVAVQMSFMFAYLGSFLCRTLARGDDVSVPEMVQAAAVAIAGLGGATVVARVTGALVVPLGTVSLCLAAGSYGVSFTFIDRRLGRRRNFVFYTTLAILFTLAGLVVLLHGPALAFAFAGAALLFVGLGSWKSRATLSLHGAVYLVAAAIPSGLLQTSARAFLGRPLEPESWAQGPLLAVLAVDAACCFFSVATHGRTWGRGSRVPKLLMIAVLALGLGGIVVTAGVQLLPRPEGSGAFGVDPAHVAALRTGVLAASSVLLAFAGRWKRFYGASWLVFPVLIAGAAKMLLEDLPAGRPSTLFLSLGLYGGALILVPRLLRRAG